MAETRYTLSLPAEVYNELKSEADKREMSIKEIVRQCLKFGLIGLKMADDPDVDLIIRERATHTSGDTSTKETLLRFL